MKRFTEALKWRDPWFRELSVDAKLVFFYFLDNCDGAGVWEPDLSMVNFCLKRDVEWDRVWSEFGDRVTRLPSGKLWMRKFIQFQYGILTESCAPHRTIIALVHKHGLTLEKGIVTLILPYASPSVRAMDKETEKDKEKDQEEPKKPRANSQATFTIPLLLATPEFESAWADWLQHRREIKKPVTPMSAQQTLAECEKMGLERAIVAIRFTIFKGWQGLREPDIREKAELAGVGKPSIYA